MKTTSFKTSQTVVEYMLVFLFAAVIMYVVANQFNFNTLRSFAIFGIVSPSNIHKVIIPPMSE